MHTFLSRHKVVTSEAVGTELKSDVLMKRVMTDSNGQQTLKAILK